MDHEQDLSTPEEITYRWARREEWKPAMALVWRTFLISEGRTYSQEGVRHFFEFITDDDIYTAFLNGGYQMLLALCGGEMVGVATLRSGNRLSLLFVEEGHQKRGIGRGLLDRLCAYLKNEAGERSITVTAAPEAVNFYRKCGFLATSAEQDHSGIRVVPMERVFGKL